MASIWLPLVHFLDVDENKDKEEEEGAETKKKKKTPGGGCAITVAVWPNDNIC
jgi:hypothetical protein